MNIVPIHLPPSARGIRPGHRHTLAQTFRQTGSCLYVYEGLACHWRGQGGTIGSDCAQLASVLKLSTVEEVRFPNRPYDQKAGNAATLSLRISKVTGLANTFP